MLFFSSKMLSSVILCINTSIDTILMFSFLRIIGLLITPFISSLLNIHVNHLLATQSENIMLCICFKAIYDYFSWFVQSNISYKQVRIMCESLLLRLNMSKIKCGVTIPGINQKQHKDLLDDTSKLYDFLYILPMIWSAIINFGIVIYNMNTSDLYPIKTLFTLLCIIMCGILTYLVDPTVYEKTKPNPKSVTKFTDSQYVKMKLSMGCILDTEFENKKRKKIETQQDIQKYVILSINLIITYISLCSKSLGQLYAFSNISWMIGNLADNIKSLQYYTYMKEFIEFTKCLESHKLNCDGKISIGMIDKVSFINASFGYYDTDLMKNPSKIQKIINLSYIFKLGVFYYLEAPNGIGKSTTLRMFTQNLFSGDIYFGNINRKNLSFDEISQSVFHIVQASEFTPKFSLEEIKSYKGRDIWLEEKLGLNELFDKDTVEMSGGQKKRMFIYIVLTSNATVLLLDEILSELSTENTTDVPEGGGWLQRVINTFIEWPGRKDKIIILVGHSLLDLIPKKSHIVKLKLSNNETNTILSTRM
jgi:ABC-type cobalamin/Fe3+-siderophores transport system ATPase subunit